MKKVFYFALCSLAFLFLPVNANAQKVLSADIWPNAYLSSPQDLANSPQMLGEPTTYAQYELFEGPLNVYGNFVSRYITKIIAPLSGTYYFWLASNQKAMLWISPDSPNFKNMTPICQLMASPPPYYRQWTRYASQRSIPLSLVKGRTYYMMLIQIEQDGDNLNHASVGWMLPNKKYERPIPGSRLTLVPPAAVSISANPAVISAGSTTTLNWAALNVLDCSAFSVPADPSWEGLKSPTGTQVVMPAVTTDYSISCTGTDGFTRTATATVELPVPMSVSFSATPSIVNPGSLVTLSWTVSNASSCSASAEPAFSLWSGSKSNVGGTQVVAPLVSTVFALTCIPIDNSSAQTTSSSVVVTTLTLNPRKVEFDPSTDHAWLDYYQLEIYTIGSTAPFYTVNMGKPVPNSTTGKITWDFSATVNTWNLPGGTYEARVSAVSTQNGLGRSNISNRFLIDIITY